MIWMGKKNEKTPLCFLSFLFSFLLGRKGGAADSPPPPLPIRHCIFNANPVVVCSELTTRLWWRCRSVCAKVLSHRWRLHSLPTTCPWIAGAPQRLVRYDHRLLVPRSLAGYHYNWRVSVGRRRVGRNTQWRNEPKHLGGAQSLRGSEATKPEGA